jgi:hypothetical protein
MTPPQQKSCATKNEKSKIQKRTVLTGEAWGHFYPGLTPKILLA